MKRSLPSLIAGGALIIVLALYMVTYQVRFNEVAVVRTFGDITPPEPDQPSPDVKTEPGLYFKWPWPVQNVTILDNRLQLTETVGAETPTRDGKNVIVTTAITWKISSPYLFSIRNYSIQDAETKLRSRVLNDQTTVVSQYDFSNLVSTDAQELMYDKIESTLFDKLAQGDEKTESVADLYGIDVKYVGVEMLTLPEKITENVFSAMKEERNAEATRYTSQGESEADRIKAEAESIAGTILAFAELRADKIVAEGKRRAAMQNKTFAQDEDLAVFLLEMEYLLKILKDRTTIILDAKPPFDLLVGTKDGDATAATRPAADPSVLPEIVQPN